VTSCKGGYEVCYTHSVHKVFVWFTRPFFAYPAHLRRVLLQLGVEIQHASLHMRASAVIHLLIFVSLLCIEHGVSHFLPVPHERVFHDDVVGGIWPKLQTLTFDKEVFSSISGTFYQGHKADHLSHTIYTCHATTYWKISLVLRGRYRQVKFNDASVYRHNHIFVIENQDASEQRALAGNQTSSGTK